MGAIGMSRQAFWSASYKDILYITDGYAQRAQDLSRESWMQTRILAYYSVMPHIKEGSLPSIESFMPLPWDRKKKAVVDELAQEDIRKKLMQNIKILNEENAAKAWRDANYKKPLKQ